ncbi:MAG TPA: hypothetical protein VK668_24230 [Mucilaginibacter sp.]|nr:hypothetical protein [Mucilaginibacter sp.]
MKKIFYLLLACLFIISVNARAQDTTSYLKAGQLKANLNYLGGSLSYEAKISQSNTLYFDAGIGLGVTYQSTFYTNTGTTYYQYAWRTALAAEFRHYYHFKYRSDNGKDIANNSSNFFALHSNYIFKPLSSSGNADHSSVVSLMPAWGIQRTIGKNFSFELELGLQASYELTKYQPSSTQFTVGPGTVVKIGHVLK